MIGKVVAVVLAATVAFEARADDYPQYGRLFRKPGNFIDYRCERRAAEDLKCTFTEVKVRNRAQPTDLEKYLSSGVDSSEVRDRIVPEVVRYECQLMAMVEKAILGRLDAPVDQAEFDKYYSSTHPKERRDTLTIASAMRTACETPTNQNIKDLMRARHDKDVRTCSVWVANFSQTFSWKAEGVWVHDDEPNGACGTLSVATFERDLKRGYLWNYKTRTLVTNKSGKSRGPAGACKDTNESEYLYEGGFEHEVYKGCDYMTYDFQLDRE